MSRRGTRDRAAKPDAKRCERDAHACATRVARPAQPAAGPWAEVRETPLPTECRLDARMLRTAQRLSICVVRDVAIVHGTPGALPRVCAARSDGRARGTYQEDTAFMRHIWISTVTLASLATLL